VRRSFGFGGPHFFICTCKHTAAGCAHVLLYPTEGLSFTSRGTGEHVAIVIQRGALRSRHLLSKDDGMQGGPVQACGHMPLVYGHSHEAAAVAHAASRALAAS
jgi:hypothetical protein